MNKSQLAALLRAALLSAGAALVEHNVVTGARLHSIVNWIVAFVTIVGPIAWSLWAKTHAQQAAAAVKLVNSVEAIVVNPDTQTVRIDPNLSLKPDTTAAVPTAAAALLVGFLALGLSGCVAPGTSTGPSTWAVFAAGGLDFGLGLAVPPVLDKNPTLATPLAGFAAGIQAAFGEQDLTPANVQATITALGARYQISLEIQSMVIKALNKGVAMYTKAFGTSVASSTNPNVKELLDGIASGIGDGVKSWQDAHTGAFLSAPYWREGEMSLAVFHPSAGYPVTYRAPDGVNEITDYGDGHRTETLVFVVPATVRDPIPQYHSAVPVLCDTFIRDEHGKVVGQIVP